MSRECQRTRDRQCWRPGKIAATAGLLAIAACLLPTPVMATDYPLTVTAGPASFSPDPVHCGVQARALLRATVVNPPEVQQQTEYATMSSGAHNAQAVQITGSTWQWAILGVDFEAPATQSWVPGDTNYYQASLKNPDTASPTLNATFLRAGTWMVGIWVTVSYTNNLGDTWTGGNSERICELPTLNATVQVRRTGSGEPYASSAIVAAGGASIAADGRAVPEIHYADVLVQTTPPVAGIYVGGLKLANGNGHTGTSEFGATAWLAYPPGTPFVTGPGGTLTGTFLSSDVVRSVTVTVQDVDPAGDDLSPGATVDQHWDDIGGASAGAGASVTSNQSSADTSKRSDSSQASPASKPAAKAKPRHRGQK